MFFKLFLPFILIASLYAEPSIEEMKAAVSANPALLDTPQAQAMMQEKGITAYEVRQSLSQKNKFLELEDEKTMSLLSNNIVDINMTDANLTDANLTEITDINETMLKLEERLNPFSYKTNKELRVELNSKQELLIAKKLDRYSKSFYTNENIIDNTSLPTPDSYIISTGDSITIHVYGNRDKVYTLDVRNDGSVDLEFIGPVKIAGMKFIEATEYLKSKLKKHYNMSYFNIIMNNYSSIQVTLVGEVKHPGIYNLTSFATVKDLLINAKGIKDNASIRNILIKRNSKIVAKLDFYDLLMKGNDFSDTLLKHGDIIIIKKADTLVSIDGYINNAAIFELKNSETLADIISYAGGMRAQASRANIKVDRYTNNTSFDTLSVAYEKASTFKMQDGDKVYIYPLDFTAKSSISIYGNIVRPGNYRIPKDKNLKTMLESSLEHGYRKFFLPETNFEYGVIKRYTDSLKYETISFNLRNVLNGQEEVLMESNDELFIFSQNDIYASSYINTKGDLLFESGKMQHYPGMTIRDAINAAGLKASEIDGIIDDKVRVTTYKTKDFMPKTTFYSLKTQGDTVLYPYDEVEVYDYYTKNTLEPVYIKGEVVNPTSTHYEKNMSLAQLVEIAGGLTNKAYKKQLSIVRYYLDKNQSRKQKIIVYDLGEVSTDEIILEAYDEVKIFKIPNWDERRVITLKGEVRFPGEYTINIGEKLSSVIHRAGGFTSEAFIEGAVFTRESIKQTQIENYYLALSKIKRELAIYSAMPANAKNVGALSQSAGKLNDVIAESEKYEPIGRVSIKLDKDLNVFDESPFNLVLKDQDTLTIPSQIDTVTVFGEVFNPTSFVYDSDKDANEYIELASGFSRSADEDSVYIIHADGTSEPINKGWLSLGVNIQKGDTIVVPIYIKEHNAIDIWDSVAKLLSSFALTAAAVNSLGVL